MAVNSRVVSGRKRGKGIIFAFLTPPILIYAAFFLYPTARAFRISLYKWSGFNFRNAEYIGLANFKEAFTDKWLRHALSGNLWFMVVGGAFLFITALLFAVVLTNPRFKGRTFFKTVIFLPHVINVVGVALLWVFVLQPRFGLLNTLLRSVGLKSLAKVWLATPYELHSFTFIIVWYVIGFYLVLLIAGIESIPGDLYDAAKVDGANEWQLFRRVTLPLLRDVLAIGLTYWIIGALKIFGIIWAISRGASLAAVNTIATYMMSYAIARGSGAVFRLGYATSIAVLLFIGVFLVSILFFRLSRAEAIEY